MIFSFPLQGKIFCSAASGKFVAGKMLLPPVFPRGSRAERKKTGKGERREAGEESGGGSEDTKKLEEGGRREGGKEMKELEENG